MRPTLPIIHLLALCCWYLLPACLLCLLPVLSACLRSLLAAWKVRCVLPQWGSSCGHTISFRQNITHKGVVRPETYKGRPYRGQLRNASADVVVPAVKQIRSGGCGKGAQPLFLAMVQVSDDPSEQVEVVASTVSCTMPDGLTHYPDVASYTKDPATGVTFGNSKLTNPSVRVQLLKLLTITRRGVLCMGLGDLPGYNGPFPLAQCA